LNEYPNWDDDKTPDTHMNTKVTKTRNVAYVYVIEVIGGMELAGFAFFSHLAVEEISSQKSAIFENAIC